MWQWHHRKFRHSYVEQIITTADASAWTNGDTATQATCVDDKVKADGTGKYKCAITFASGAKSLTAQTTTVRANGSWLVDPDIDNQPLGD